jgi:hypothetical protein
VTVADWSYPHRDLGERAIREGSPILRPVVPPKVEALSEDLLAVVDSGSPISVADEQLFKWLGVDLRTTQPLYEVPLSLGSNFNRIPMYEVELSLRPPDGVEAVVVKWKLHLGGRPNWKLPFAVLFGQQGWFDRFPTTIDRIQTTVHTG